MDKASQERFYKIVKKELKELNKEDIAFLKARRSYLIDRELAKFKSILEDKKIEKIKKTEKNK